MSAVQAVTFDPVLFLARYPEFAGTAPSLLQAYFTEACMAGVIDNSGSGPVSDTSPGGQLAILLNMVTAHVTFLAQRGATAVGRISNGSEGSVSTAMDMGSGSDSDVKNWLRQSQYGAAFLAATSGFRRGFYVPPLGPTCSPLPGFGAGPCIPYGGFGSGWGFGYGGF